MIGIYLVAGLLTFGMTGCHKETKKEEVNQQQEVTEPTQTKEAKKLKQFSDIKKGDTVAEIKVKDFGVLIIKLFPKQAPKAVENFVTHAKEGYYDGLTFHRVIKDFMIQGGDPNGNGTGGESIWGEPFEDEFSKDLYPYRGALCMANRGANTNESQFFIVQGDSEQIKTLSELITEKYEVSLNEYFSQAYQTQLTQDELDRFLQYGGAPWLTKHHTVFGQLMDGYEVLDAIAQTKADESTGETQEPVVIESIKITTQE